MFSRYNKVDNKATNKAVPPGAGAKLASMAAAKPKAQPAAAAVVEPNAAVNQALNQKELKRRGRTVVAITHDDRYFSAADRVVKFVDGRIDAGPARKARVVKAASRKVRESRAEKANRSRARAARKVRAATSPRPMPPNPNGAKRRLTPITRSRRRWRGSRATPDRRGTPPAAARQMAVARAVLQDPQPGRARDCGRPCAGKRPESPQARRHCWPR